MNAWEQLARQALRGALQVRRQAQIPKSDPICVFDVAEKLGIEVRFCAGSSFEGMYANASETILVASQRPSGRQAFTCAHELGHWFFRHGSRIDELTDMKRRRANNSEEWLVNMFAGHLLMPVWAIREAFSRRSWNPATCNPFQVYCIAAQLGVGYTTLIQHLYRALSLISLSHAQDLAKSSNQPKQLKQRILGDDTVPHLIIVDRCWRAVPIDLRVGDCAILPRNTVVEGLSVSRIATHELGIVVRAQIPGISRTEAKDGNWAAFIRICRKEFEGRSIYRHLEDPDVNEDA